MSLADVVVAILRDHKTVRDAAMPTFTACCTCGHAYSDGVEPTQAWREHVGALVEERAS